MLASGQRAESGYEAHSIFICQSKIPFCSARILTSLCIVFPIHINVGTEVSHMYIGAVESFCHWCSSLLYPCNENVGVILDMPCSWFCNSFIRWFHYYCTEDVWRTTVRSSESSSLCFSQGTAKPINSGNLRQPAHFTFHILWASAWQNLQ